MARTPKPTDFTVDVDGVGTFTFARRRMADETAIQVEYARILDGVKLPTDWLASLADWQATLKVLTVRAPEGWDVDELDPLEPDSYGKLSRVFAALREKEGSFRRKHGADGEGSGAPAV